MISFADWCSWDIYEASPLIRDSLQLTKEVTSFASVLRSSLFQPWNPRLGEGYHPCVWRAAPSSQASWIKSCLSCSPVSATSVGVAVRGFLRAFWLKVFLSFSSTAAWFLPLHLKGLLFTSPRVLVYPSSPFGHHKLSVSLGTLILYIYRAAFMDDAWGSLPVCGQSVISCTWLSSSDSTCSTEYEARSCTQ